MTGETPKNKGPRLSPETILQATVSFEPGAAVSTPAVPPREAIAATGRLGRFELRSLLGSGAFGEVFRAYDPKLDREIALKVARPQRLADADDAERFIREARAAAQFQHPHIVPVYEVGQSGSFAYLVAALVEGDTLKEALTRRKFAWAESVELVLQLADALHYAHLKGVFHRDIKPGNVLLDRAGQAHLTDFGLARRLEGEALQTQEGKVLGTPAYMSPEQARGDSRVVDARSDLYSLGVILYEMLCRRRPFDGSVFDVLHQLQADEPKRPRLIDKHIPADLEAICLKALAKHPEDRYRSVEHFAEDLRRWSQGLPVEARQITPLQRAGKWVRRNPLLTGALAFVAALSLIVPTAFVAYQQTRPAWLDLRVTPAAEVRVTLDGRELVVNENGRVYAQSRPGRYQLQVAASGYEPQRREVLLVRGQQNASVVAIDLEPRFGYVTLSSEPEGAAVQIKDRHGVLIARGVTPYHSPRLATGNYQAQVDHDLYEPQTIPFAVPLGGKLATLPPAKLKARYKESAAYDFLQQVRNRLSQASPKVDYIEQPLNEIVKDLQQKWQLDLVLDEQALENAAIPVNQQITASIDGQPLAEALRRLLQRHGLTVVPQQEVGGKRWYLLITTFEAAESKLIVVLHDVRDLVSRSGNYDALIDALKTSIEPFTWDEVGGSGSISVNRELRALSISQTWAVQQKVTDYFSNMRQLKLAK